MKILRLALLALLIAAAAVIWWRWSQPRVKTIPASGGSDMTVQLPDGVHFMQNDPRWARLPLGARDTVGRGGCAVSSLAMALSNLGHAADPGKLSTALKDARGITSDGWIVWDAVSRVTGGTLRAEVHAEPSMERLDACLARGDYPLVKFLIHGVVPHWVVLTAKRGGTFFMRDPLIAGAEPLPLTKRTSVILSVRCIGRNPRAITKAAPAPAVSGSPGKANAPGEPVIPAGAAAPPDLPRSPAPSPR